MFIIRDCLSTPPAHLSSTINVSSPMLIKPHLVDLRVVNEKIRQLTSSRKSSNSSVYLPLSPSMHSLKIRNRSQISSGSRKSSNLDFFSKNDLKVGLGIESSQKPENGSKNGSHHSKSNVSKNGSKNDSETDPKNGSNNSQKNKYIIEMHTSSGNSSSSSLANLKSTNYVESVENSENSENHENNTSQSSNQSCLTASSYHTTHTKQGDWSTVTSSTNHNHNNTNMTTLNGMRSGKPTHHHYEHKEEVIIDQKGGKSGRSSSREAQRLEQNIEKSRFVEKQKKKKEVDHKNKLLNNSQHQYQHKIVRQNQQISEKGHSFSSGTSSFGSIGQNSTVVA